MATNNAIDSNIPITVAKGGTGATTLTSHGLLVGNDTAAVSALAEAATGQTVMGSTGNNPTLTNSPSFGGSVTAGTSITASSGDVTITSGDLKLPASTSSVGRIKIDGTVVYMAKGGSNDFIGNGAGNYTLTGAYNFGAGTNALSSLTSGSSNVAIGYEAGKSITSAGTNCAIGAYSGTTNETGAGNVSIGYEAGKNLISGAYNVMIGYQAGSACDNDESNNLLISNAGVDGEDNTIRIGTTGSGSGQQSKCFIAGIRGVTTGTADAIDVLIDSSGQLGTASSSIRFKDDVRDIGDRSQEVYKLRPVSFVFKEQKSPVRQYGLIAEEVEKVLPELVIKDKDGECETVKYREIPTLLLNELIVLRAKVEALKARLAQLKGR